MHYLTALETAIEMLDNIARGKVYNAREYHDKLNAIRKSYEQANDTFMRRQMVERP